MQKGKARTVPVIADSLGRAHVLCFVNHIWDSERPWGFIQVVDLSDLADPSHSLKFCTILSVEQRNSQAFDHLDPYLLVAGMCHPTYPRVLRRVPGYSPLSLAHCVCRLQLFQFHFFQLGLSSISWLPGVLFIPQQPYLISFSIVLSRNNLPWH